MSRDKTKARESILEDLAKNVSLNLHNYFYLNKESKVKNLPNRAKRLQEHEQLKGWEEITISSDDEEELSSRLQSRLYQGPASRRRGART